MFSLVGEGISLGTSPTSKGSLSLGGRGSRTTSGRTKGESDDGVAE